MRLLPGGRSKSRICKECVDDTTATAVPDEVDSRVVIELAGEIDEGSEIFKDAVGVKLDRSS